MIRCGRAPSWSQAAGSMGRSISGCTGESQSFIIKHLLTSEEYDVHGSCVKFYHDADLNVTNEKRTHIGDKALSWMYTTSLGTNSILSRASGNSRNLAQSRRHGSRFHTCGLMYQVWIVYFEQCGELRLPALV